MTERDTQRSQVYAAEGFVRTLFDRAAEHGSRSIDFFGTALTLPSEARFASVESVQRYVDDVLQLPVVRQQWASATPLRVRSRRAASQAHYENRGGVGTIALAERVGQDWAMRELVVLHEIAHHLCWGAGAAHGPEFVATYCELAGLVMGPEAAYVLRVVYANEGVRG